MNERERVRAKQLKKNISQFSWQIEKQSSNRLFSATRAPNGAFWAYQMLEHKKYYGDLSFFLQMH